MRFSQREIKDLLIAWVMISVAFSIFMSTDKTDVNQIISLLFLSAVTVGFAFIIHELAHKFTAQHYGKFAEFHASIPMLILSILLAFTSVLIAAPGAVIISGFVNKRENGIISAAGPLSNIALAALLLPIVLLLPAESMLLGIAVFALIINAFLAAFNMIPFWVFDGAKIITWNKPIYFSMLAAAVALMFVGWTLS